MIAATKQIWQIRYNRPAPTINNYLFLLTIFCFIFAVANSAKALESTIAYPQLQNYQRLNVDYNQFSRDLYHYLSNDKYHQDYRSFDLITAEAQHEMSQKKVISALRLLISHEPLIKSNINSQNIIKVESILLNGYEYDTAARYLTYIQANSDPSIVSNVQYAFAKYYFAHDQWSKTIGIIHNIINDLPSRLYQHALLMQAVSLQNIRHQRRAISLYKMIRKNSPDYVAARINMAIADTRQGWWTDGYNILKNLLSRKDVIRDKSLSDRIHTLIGYIFLQQEYYRNSRDAFRKVDLHGPYTKKALLGIALDASYQQDYVGALNAAHILKNMHSNALEVSEANLLLPYFYEKLGQSATASAAYTDAISYYRIKIGALTKTINSLHNNALHIIPTTNTNVSLQKQKIDLGDYLPLAFFKQYALLHRYREDLRGSYNTKLKQQCNHLLNRFNTLIRIKIKHALDMKKNYLMDYMNQSRYGLARVYDNNQASTH